MQEENKGGSQQKYEIINIEPGTLPKKEPQVLTQEQKNAFDNAWYRIDSRKINEYKRNWVIMFALCLAAAGGVGLGIRALEPVVMYSGIVTAALVKDAVKISELIKERAGIKSRRKKSSEAESEMNKIFNTSTEKEVASELGSDGSKGRAL